VSGPLLDRIDLHVEVPAVPFRDLATDERGEESAAVRERVIAARMRQMERYPGTRTYCNAQLRPSQLKKYCRLDGASRTLIEQGMTRLGLSARAYTRVLKVARTIADLEGNESIRAAHVAEAIQYRSLDRPVL
jgi:magnesium chelatase family protein